MSRRRTLSERPCIETLESRTLLAATTAAIVGADLVVTGTSGADSISITRNAGTGAYTIGGIAGTFTAMGNLRINAGAGNDTVILTNVSIGDVTNGKQGNLIFEGGAGADSLTCHHVEASSAVITDSADGLFAIFDIGPAADRCELTGGITFTGSAANDSLRLLAARIWKNVVCNMGDGSNFIQTTTDTGFSTVVEGSLSYTGGTGTDSVQIQNSSWLYGGLTANLGDGTNTVTFQDAMLVNGITSKLAAASITGGAGNDTITADHLVGGGLTAKLGDGVNWTIVAKGAGATGSNLDGALSVTGGVGDDHVQIVGSTVTGAVTATLGDGSNSLETAADGALVPTLGGKVSYAGGLGNDALSLLGGPNIRGALTATLGDGTNSVTTRDATVRNAANAWMPVTITGGAGADTVTMDALWAGNLKATLGEGTNWFRLQRGAGSRRGYLFGSLTISGGSGQDNGQVLGSSIEGGLTATLGSGTNALTWTLENAVLPILMGKLTYTGGEGNDAMLLTRGQIGGLKASLGDGINSLSLRDTTLYDTPSGKYTPLQYTGGAGNDTLTADHLESGAVTVKLGGGPNAARLQKGAGSAGCLIHGNVAITAAEGNDTVELTGATIQGNSTLSLGEGTNVLNTSFADFTSTEISGKLGYTGGAGADSLNLLGYMTIANGLTAKLGDGTNSVSFRDTYMTNGAGGANVAITGGSGPDTISGDSLVAGNFTANLGEGNNACHLYRVLGTSRTTLSGKAAITGGAGADVVDIQGADLRAGLTVKAGNGANQLIVQAYIGTGVTLGGPVSYAGGDGVDTINWTAGVVGTGSTSFPSAFTLGAGDDTFSATTNATSAFWGAVTVNAGAGADHITFGTFFGGKTKVDGGSDTDFDTFVDGHNYGLPAQPVVLHMP